MFDQDPDQSRMVGEVSFPDCAPVDLNFQPFDRNPSRDEDEIDEKTLCGDNPRVKVKIACKNLTQT